MCTRTLYTALLASKINLLGAQLVRLDQELLNASYSPRYTEWMTVEQLIARLETYRADVDYEESVCVQLSVAGMELWSAELLVGDMPSYRLSKEEQRVLEQMGIDFEVDK